MAGNLLITTPWREAAVPQPLRDELRAAVPDGWTIGLSASGDPGWPKTRYTAWCDDDRSGAKRLYVTKSRDAGHAIVEVIAWIEANETWTEGPPPWEVVRAG